MDYKEAELKRIFIIKFSHKDDLLEELTDFCINKKINNAFFFCLGALKKAKMVVGPDKAILPPKPIFKKFNDGRELIGIGSVFLENKIPKIHLHTSIGRKNRINLGCIRENAKVYIVMEVFLIEVKGIKAERKFDPKTQLNLLNIIS